MAGQNSGGAYGSVNGAYPSGQFAPQAQFASQPNPMPWLMPQQAPPVNGMPNPNILPVGQNFSPPAGFPNIGPQQGPAMQQGATQQGPMPQMQGPNLQQFAQLFNGAQRPAPSPVQSFQPNMSLSPLAWAFSNWQPNAPQAQAPPSNYFTSLAQLMAQQGGGGQPQQASPVMQPAQQQSQATTDSSGGPDTNGAEGVEGGGANNDASGGGNGSDSGEGDGGDGGP